MCATRNGAEALRSPVPSPICVRLKCAVILCYEPSLALHLRGASPSAMSSNQNRASRCVFGNKTKLSHNLSCPRLVLLSPFHLLELPSVLAALFPSPSSFLSLSPHILWFSLEQRLRTIVLFLVDWPLVDFSFLCFVFFFCFFPPKLLACSGFTRRWSFEGFASPSRIGERTVLERLRMLLP